MDIGIIGAGRVGCSLGKYLFEKGISITGYYSRSKESAEQAATFTKSNVFSSKEELVRNCQVIWITTPDDEIFPVWESIREFVKEKKTICHFSGSLSSDVFSDRNRTDISVCSIHPVFAFNNKFESWKFLDPVLFTIEGDEEAAADMKALFEGVGNPVQLIRKENKIRYHAAAVMASNLVIGLYRMSVGILKDCGFTGDMAEKMLGPLVYGNVKRLLESSPEEALTGPIERADAGTVKKHLEALGEKEREIYLLLGEQLIPVAQKKNPKMDYGEIGKLWEAEGFGTEEI